ncbi:class I SAM-dependent methyltransferase [candidate division CSSED10-310 bacterium]|uniref:Class I SAM-dependent methyltransferase n=1 Tax=candidate division CSSED10-310 bacterium TaxID=2855610 RepID=A0ABV6YYR9_UNCC1
MERAEYYKMYEHEDHYWWYRGLHELVLSYVEESSLGKPLRILDAGCGTGRLMQLLQPFGQVEGFDASKDAILLCTKRGLQNIRINNLNTWEPPHSTFDVIISNDVVCRSTVDDDWQVIKKYQTALKSKGILIINYPAFELLRRAHDTAVFGKRRYRKRDIKQQYHALGFRIRSATYRLPLLFILIFLKKFLFESWVAKDKLTSDLKPINPFVNRVLLAMHRVDNWLVRRKIPLFLGSSLFVVCQKP